MNHLTLKHIYTEKVVSDFLKSSDYSNKHEVPSIIKIVINSGISALEDKSWVKEVQDAISKIAGQKAVTTKARKSISNFKLREGMPVGVMVTLRGDRMWNFLDKFINLVLPNVRDFRGVPKKFDGHGNYNIGISDHTVFPETRGETVKKNIGMDIAIVTSCQTDKEGVQLLEYLGMPFFGGASSKK